MTSRGKRTVIMILLAALPALLFCAGFLGYLYAFKKQPPDLHTQIIQENVSMESSPHYKIILETNYKECGHSVIMMEDDALFKGKSADAIKEIFREEYVFLKEENNTLYFGKMANGSCIHHYIAKIYRERVSIFYKQPENTLYKVLEIDVSRLPSADILALTEGIPLDGEAALTSFLEDFGS